MGLVEFQSTVLTIQPFSKRVYIFSRREKITIYTNKLAFLDQLFL